MSWDGWVSLATAVAKCVRVRHVHLYGTDSLEAADVFDNTDAVQGDDAAQPGAFIIVYLVDGRDGVAN